MKRHVAGTLALLKRQKKPPASRGRLFVCVDSFAQDVVAVEITFDEEFTRRAVTFALDDLE